MSFLTSNSIQKRNRRTALLFLIPGAIYFGLVFLYPIFSTIYMSLFDVDVTNFVSGAWKFVGLGNYVALFGFAETWTVIGNSVIFVVGSIIPQFVIALLLAVGLRKPTRLNTVMRALVLTPWLLPSVTVAAVFLWIFNARGGLANWLLQSLGLIDNPIQWFTSGGSALFVIILVNIWIGIPFNFLILQSGLQAVDESVHEAAVVDGAGWWRELVSVTLPIMKESVFMVFMLGLIGTLKVFDYVWIMTKGGPANATQLPGTYAYSTAFEVFEYGRASAIVVLVVLILVATAALYIFLTTRDRDAPSKQERRAAVVAASRPRRTSERIPAESQVVSMQANESSK